MYRNVLLVVVLLTIILSACNPTNRLASKPTITPTPDYPGAPEPHGPNIRGTISGLPIGMSATIIAKLPSSDGGIYGVRGNGAWEMEVLYKEGTRRKVIAHADALRVQPAEYVIYFKNGKAYLVVEGVESDQEAIGLDFKFYH